MKGSKKLKNPTVQFMKPFDSGRFSITISSLFNKFHIILQLTSTENVYFLTYGTQNLVLT